MAGGLKRESVSRKLKGNKNAVNRYKDCNYRVDQDVPWELALSAAIIRQAIADGRRKSEGKDCRFVAGIPATKNEIVSFFHSRWCSVLTCGLISTDELLEAAGL